MEVEDGEAASTSASLLAGEEASAKDGEAAGEEAHGEEDGAEDVVEAAGAGAMAVVCLPRSDEYFLFSGYQSSWYGGSRSSWQNGWGGGWGR